MIFVPIENIKKPVDIFARTVGNFSRVLIVLKYTRRFTFSTFADSENPTPN